MLPKVVVFALLFALALVLGPSVLPEEALAAGNENVVHRFVADGTWAEVTYIESAAGVNTFVYLGVMRGGTRQAPETLLTYSVSRCDTNWNCTYDQGYGQIPNGDMTENGNKVRLSTHTSRIQGFSTLNGAIDLEWERTRAYQADLHINSKVTLGSYSRHEVGHQEYDSARAQGSLAGTAIPSSSYAYIGQRHGMTIELTKNTP